MSRPQSRLTSQGQISVPVEVRRKLGLGPGSVIEWEEEGDHVVVRRVGRFSSEDIHRAVFRKAPKAKTVDDMKQAVARQLRKKHARD